MDHLSTGANPPKDYLRRQVPDGKELCRWPFTAEILIERKQWDPWYTLAVDKIGDQVELTCLKKSKDGKLCSERLRVAAIEEHDENVHRQVKRPRRGATKDSQEISVLTLRFPVNRNFDLKNTIIKECSQHKGWKKQVEYLKSIADLFNVSCVVNPEAADTR